MRSTPSRFEDSAKNLRSRRKERRRTGVAGEVVKVDVKKRVTSQFVLAPRMEVKRMRDVSSGSARHDAKRCGIAVGMLPTYGPDYGR